MNKWLFIASALLFLTSVAHAGGTYTYAGTYNTALVAYQNQATMTQTGTLTCKKCWANAWVILWDSCPNGAVIPCDTSQRSENYVEAGIGQDTYDGWTRKGEQAVALWWASNANPNGTSVGKLPTGTPVTVSLQKQDGQRSITIRWDWPGGTQSLSVPVAGWLNGPGIHPVKAEMFGTSAPVYMDFTGVSSWQEDTLQGTYLGAEGPYRVTGTLNNFSVR